MLSSFKLLGIIALTVFIAACENGKAPEPEPNPKPVTCSEITYKSDIKPLINNKCSIAGCHHAGSTNGDYTNYNGIKTKVESGALHDRVVVKKDMPPGTPLTSEEISKINCWINNGAPEN